MAIKRPSKSMGTPYVGRWPQLPCAMSTSGQSSRWFQGIATSGGCVRTAHAECSLPLHSHRQEAKWPCPNIDDQLTALKCPHCGDEDLYRWSARSEHEYTLKSTGN